jgi:hypothetical protein
MDELVKLYDKYRAFNHTKLYASKADFDELFQEFIKDFDVVIDILARMYNEDKYPQFYDINESTIVGAIARIVKLYKECVHLFKEKNDDVLGLIIRPLFETTIIVRYLIVSGANSQKNFRLVSYKSRFQNYKKLIADENLQEVPAAKRLLEKLNTKIERDGFTIQDLEDEQASGGRKWKLDGKSFYDIHKEVGDENHYSFVYGVGSDSVHGNWQEINDYHLTGKYQNHYSGFLNYEDPKCITIIPIIDFIMNSFSEYLEWNGCFDENNRCLFEILTHWNRVFYDIYEEKYSESVTETDRS